ncbi:hypothetical protein N7539_000110 [Penicillium diatomitis]|uniref:Uncharacterized protein n=1 Tax=Penicillium diatomitis TaxID=2819901 RepID=A0A9X0C2F0_9EURO|nr:uncharacterized protein N7539_000110 [Penicillium diatomitis]KAJ5494994.1 hypothetical protein N7539_000110 [Penicillium diatomitis]
MSLWNIVNPLRPDSIFHAMTPALQQIPLPLPKRSNQWHITRFGDHMHLITVNESPYLHAASALSVIMNFLDQQLTYGQMQLFMSLYSWSVSGSALWERPGRTTAALFVVRDDGAKRLVGWIKSKDRVSR